MQLFASGVALIFGVLTLGWSVSAQAEVEALAKLVCDTTRGTKRQIAHVSQIEQLVQFFLRPLDGKHKFYECQSKYLGALVDLERVVLQANDDACGERKIELIEKFHRDYISKVSKDVKQRKRTGSKAPKLVKLFFMQYASKISSICEQRAHSIIARDDLQQPIGDREMNTLNELKRFTDLLGMSDLSKGFRGTFLFWNMVDLLGLDDDKMFGKYLDQGQVRVNVQMKDGRAIRTLQTLCQHKLRPLYSQVVLPVLRLVDMGYYPESDRLLSDDPRSRSLYLATQVCETVLPVRVFEDENLAGEQFVALKKEEADRLAQPEPIKGDLAKKARLSADIKPQSVNLGTVVSADANEARASIKMIKADVESRSKVIGKMLKVAVKRVKDKIGAQIGKMLFRRDANLQLEPVDDVALASRVDENQALVPEEEEDEDEDDKENEARRVKRSGFFHTVRTVFAYIAWIIYIIVLQSLKIANLLLPPFIIVILPLTAFSLIYYPDELLMLSKSYWSLGVDIRDRLGIKKDND